MRPDFDKSGWVKVSKTEPCQVCKRKSWCTRSADGNVAKCMRVQSDHPVTDRHGTVGFVHWLNNPLPERTPERPKPDVDLTETAKRFYDHPEAAHCRYKLATDLGVSPESVDRLRVGCHAPGTSDFGWTIPERHENGHVCGIAMRSTTGAKWMLRGSNHGIYYAEYFDPHGKGPIFVVEGFSDTAALLTLGLSVIGRFSNTGGSAQIANLLRSTADLMNSTGRAIVVIGERDKRATDLCPWDCDGCVSCWPGLFGADATARTLAQELGMSIKFCLSPDGTKDVREWFRDNSGASAEDFVNACRESYNDNGGCYDFRNQTNFQRRY